jgi:hypothetical protein
MGKVCLRRNGKNMIDARLPLSFTLSREFNLFLGVILWGHDMRSIVAFTGILASLLLAASPILADNTAPAQVYFFSIRSITADQAPQFLQAIQTASADQATPVQGCDGNTYYLSDDDAASVNSAISAGDTVQLHTAAEGTAPQDASILCLVQASQ